MPRNNRMTESILYITLSSSWFSVNQNHVPNSPVRVNSFPGSSQHSHINRTIERLAIAFFRHTHTCLNPWINKVWVQCRAQVKLNILLIKSCNYQQEFCWVASSLKLPRRVALCQDLSCLSNVLVIFFSVSFIRIVN